jgi:signal transduction histidine kinase
MGPDAHPVRAMTTGDGGHLARRLLLVVLAFSVFAALIVLAMTSGIIGVPVARGLTAFGASAGLLSVVVVTARRVSALSDRQREASLAREQVATQLEVLVQELEQARRAADEAKLRAERILGASTGISDALAQIPTTGLNIALQAIAMQAQLLTGGAYAALGIGDDPERPFDPWVVVGMPDGIARTIGRLPRPRGMLALSARFEQTVRLADIRAHPEATGLPPGHPPIVSLLSTPVRYAGKVVGNIYVANKKGAAEFSEDDERSLLMLAARAGAAIETARLYAREATGRIWLQTVFDQMPETVVVTNSRGEVIIQSRASRQLAMDARELGLDRVSAPGGPRAADGKPLPAEQHPFFRVLALDEEVEGVEIALPGPDGTLPFRISAKRIPLENGERGAIAVLQDIRAFKALERLRQEWASVVAHDLRQPISTIHTGAQLLLERCKAVGAEHAAAQMIERILRATTRLARMTDDLLDISRIEARQLQIERSLVDIGEVVDRAAGAARILCATRPIHVSAEQDLSVLADAGRIEQVLSNLLGNALKYGDPNTPIAVEARQREGAVEVIVTNAGPGIPQDELPGLFDRFGRSRDARKSGKPGLGLGLYIAKGLVEAHGGRIWVESAAGKTSFHFTLPTLEERASSEHLALPDRPQPKVA